MAILIFDYDGVIVDSMPLVLEVLNKLGPKYGINLSTREDVENLFEKNVYDSLRELGLDEHKLENLKEKLGLRLLLLQSHVKLFKIKTVLKKLKKKNKLFVITSNLSIVIKHNMKKNNIEFDDVIGAETEKSKVKKILALKELYPNEEYYYIGDTSGDIVEGKEAYVKTIAVTWGYHKRDRLEKVKPDYIIDSPKELLFLA